MKKILALIYNGEKFLALHSKPHPEHGNGGWFVVTGAIENEETPEEAVKREVKEETNLDVEEVFGLNWGSIYKWWDEVCEEDNFIALVNSEDIKLNEEHDKFEWLNLEKFIEKINWDDDKKILKEVLEKAIKKEKRFKEKEIKDYRSS